MIKKIFNKYSRAIKIIGIIILIPVLFIIVGNEDTSVVSMIELTVSILLFSPFILLGFFQICIWGYHFVKHGDMFYESKRLREEVIEKESVKRKQKKMCPICKRPTYCRVTWAKGMKCFVHVVRD